MVVQTILKILLLFENLLDVHEIIQFDNNTFVIYLYRISIFFFLEDTYERLILEAKTNTKTNIK